MSVTRCLVVSLILCMLTEASRAQQPTINLSSLQQQQQPSSGSNQASDSTSDNVIKFDLKLVNVDSASARFELVDDNKTTINYAISYVLTSKTMAISGNGEEYMADSIKASKDFQLQTNSLDLLNKQEELLTKAKALNSNLDSNEEESSSTPTQNKDEADSGEKYNSDEIEEIKHKNYEDIHRFLVEDLEPNRYYEINFTIKAKLAHLSSSLLLLSTTSLNNGQKSTEYLYKKVETTRQLQFKFKTTFDLNRAALLACNNSKYDQQSSCYVPNSDCKQCRPTCYQVKESRNNLGNQTSSSSSVPSSANSLVLCEACPCDTSRSTGVCIATEQETRPENKFLQSQLIKCKQCIKPYTGLLCNECENDGFDNYKNEFGECVKCDCGGNAMYDILNEVARGSYKRRKCQAITGNLTFICLFSLQLKGLGLEFLSESCFSGLIYPEMQKIL
jgi:hypothetical protein